MDHVYYSPPTRPFQPRQRDDLPRLLAHGFLPTLLRQAPHTRQVDHIPRRAHAQRPPGLARDDDAPPPCRADQRHRVPDQVAPRLEPASRHARPVADLEADAARDGGRQRFHLEVVGQPDGEVQRNQVAVEVGACVQEGLLVGWSQGDQIVGLGEAREALVLGGVGEREVQAAEQGEGLGCIGGRRGRGGICGEFSRDGLGEGDCCVAD